MDKHFHLLIDFGIYKSSLKRKFYNCFAARTDVEAMRARLLIERRGQMYTLDEIDILSGWIVSGNDDCVMYNGGSSLEVFNAERAYKEVDRVRRKINELRHQEQTGL